MFVSKLLLNIHSILVYTYFTWILFHVNKTLVQMYQNHKLYILLLQPVCLLHNPTILSCFDVYIVSC
jgi:hypothetical protein